MTWRLACASRPGPCEAGASESSVPLLSYPAAGLAVRSEPSVTRRVVTISRRPWKKDVREEERGKRSWSMVVCLCPVCGFPCVRFSFRDCGGGTTGLGRRPVPEACPRVARRFSPKEEMQSLRPSIRPAR